MLYMGKLCEKSKCINKKKKNIYFTRSAHIRHSSSTHTHTRDALQHVQNTAQTTDL